MRTACRIRCVRRRSRARTTHIPALVDVIREIGPASYIDVRWNADGTCNDVSVDDSSRLKPGPASGA